jgi:hypothetical protein
MDPIMVQRGNDQGLLMGWADRDTALVRFLGADDVVEVPVSELKTAYGTRAVGQRTGMTTPEELAPVLRTVYFDALLGRLGVNPHEAWAAVAQAAIDALTGCPVVARLPRGDVPCTLPRHTGPHDFTVTARP